MAKFNRFNGTVLPFASNATGLNRTIFGDTVQSDDINLNLNDKFKLGWEIVGPNEAPTKQDFNALSYTTTYLLSYLYQQGIPEWNENQKYYVNSYVVGSDGMIYRSLTGDETNPNIGNNPINDTVNWRPIIKYEDFANVDLSNVEDSILLNKVKNVDGAGSGLDADLFNGKTLEEVLYDALPKGTILEFMLIENGAEIRYVTDPIDERATSQGFELFCPHDKEEYEMARQYLLSIGKPKSMGPLGIYYPKNGPGCCDWYMKNYPLNSSGLGSQGWKVKDGSPTWWAADTINDITFDRRPIAEPNGDYTAYAYLGIWYDDNGYIKYYNDGNNSYSYTTYLCVRRKK